MIVEGKSDVTSRLAPVLNHFACRSVTVRVLERSAVRLIEGRRRSGKSEVGVIALSIANPF